MLHFTCACGQNLKVLDDLAGWKTQCPGCKQLIPVPSPEPETPSPPEREPATVPWKGIAIGASAVALIAVIVAIASAGGSSRGEDPEAAAGRYKGQIEERDRKIDHLESELSKRGDYAKLAERAKSAEAERDRLRQELMAAETRRPEVREPQKPSQPSTTPAPAGGASTDRSEDTEVKTLTSEEILERYFGAVVIVSTPAGPGGGFFVQADGLVVTRYGGVARSERRLVTYIDTSNRKRVELEAEVVAVDAKNDLALLKVAVPKLVPIVQLEGQFALGAGQELTVLGNPLPGSPTNDHSLLRGKVSDIWAPAEGKNFIKMTIPITAAHAGTPVFNILGRVVGVSKLPDERGFSVGEAIPAAHVRALVDNRETTFAVRRSSPESEGNPSEKGVVLRAGAEVSAGAIPVDGILLRLLLDDERDRIVGVDSKGQGIAVVSISQKKVKRKITTGALPTHIQPTINPDVVWVGHASSGNLVKVDLEEGRIFDRVSMPTGFDHFAATRNHLWVYSRGNSYLVTLRDKEVTPVGLQFGAVAHDRRRDVLVGLALNLGDTKMFELDPDKTGPLFRDIADIRANPTTHPRRKELDDLKKDLESRIKTWNAPAEILNGLGKGIRFRIQVDRNSRVIINRLLLKKDRLDTVVASFPLEPYSRWTEPGNQDAADLFGEELLSIVACSPDGRWVVTGTQVIDAEKLTTQFELPAPTLAAAFSSDSKKLYAFDIRRGVIVTFDLDAKIPK